MKASQSLNWEPVWEIEDTLKYTVNWYKEHLMNSKNITLDQLNDYIDFAKNKNIVWTNKGSSYRFFWVHWQKFLDHLYKLNNLDVFCLNRRDKASIHGKTNIISDLSDL